MAFQQARTRPPLRTHALLEPSQPTYTEPRANVSATGGGDGGVVIISPGPRAQRRQPPIAPPSPTETATTASLPSPLSPEWTILNLRSQVVDSPRPTDRSLSFSSSSAASFGTGAALSPALAHPTEGQGLLPQHDGGGRFFGHDGVVQSDSNTSGGVGTSESEEDGARSGGAGRRAWPARPGWRQRESSIDSAGWSPQLAQARSLLDSRSTRPTGHLPISHWAAQSLTQSATSTAAGTEVGGSWALTEAALASVPDATRGEGGLQLELGRAASAVLTDEESAGEDGEGGASGGEEGSHDDGDEPMAASAGLSAVLRRSRRSKGQSMSGQSWTGSYPSPPPEGARSATGSTATKRRHRHAGKAGSQKRSSAAGSVRGAFSDLGKARSRARAPAVAAAGPAPPTLAQAAAANAARHRTAPATTTTPLFLASTLARLARADSDTLALFADADGDSYLGPDPHDSFRSSDPTPTQSRATSPSLVAHGLAALSRYAQDELDDLSPAFHVRADPAPLDEDNDSGADTETEGVKTKWVKQYRPPSPALTDDGEGALARSFSARSLPAYLGGAEGLNMTTSLGLKGVGRLAEEGEAASSPWGGELDGREAALSYWRRLLRQIRGF